MNADKTPIEKNSLIRVDRRSSMAQDRFFTTRIRRRPKDSAPLNFCLIEGGVLIEDAEQDHISQLLRALCLLRALYIPGKTRRPLIQAFLFALVFLCVFAPLR